MNAARTPDGTPRPMRFAYADPPYPGQSGKYRNHPDYAGEVDHGELIVRLERDYPDGWALSTSQAALQQILGLCPTGVRIAVWHVTNSAPFRFGANWWLSWEPVIIRGGRLNVGLVKNVLSCAAPTGALGNQLPGQKPPRFARWVAELLGAIPDDQIDDLFPGSGTVGRELAAFTAQLML